MSLITCPECGNRISEYADNCPSCGCPSRLWKTSAIPSYLKTGQRFSMGSWGGEAIDWRVLDVSGRTALVIADKVIDYVEYDDTFTVITWEDCTLRQWLNGTFYSQAFSSDEKAFIRTSTISNPDNRTYNTRGDNATTDRVFCLSIDEAKQFFSGDGDRTAVSTAHARNRCAYSYDPDIPAAWWLRSPGNSQDYAAYVFIFGSVEEGGCRVDHTLPGVRPALYINLES